MGWGGCHGRVDTVAAGREAVGRAVEEVWCSSQPWAGWEGYHLSYFILLTTLDMFLILFLVYIVSSRSFRKTKFFVSI